MEKSLEQIKHIERISRQTRRHRTHLNQVCDQNLRSKLDLLDNEREQCILRAISRRQIEQQRKQLLGITIKQIARERQQNPLKINTAKIEQETIENISQKNESRPTSSVKLPVAGSSCRLFSHNCQLYPCQPVYEYKSFIKRDHDKVLQQRNSSIGSPMKASHSPHLKELFTTVQEKKHEQHRRQIALAVQSQHHLVNRHVSMERAMARLDEQSRLLHERLNEKKTFGYDKDRQHQLSQAIQSHLKVTAKFCA